MGRSDFESVARAVEWLVAAQREDGSWGYRPGGVGFVEPTALALLSLVGSVGENPTAADALRRSVTWLMERQREDGGWGVTANDDESSWMTGYPVWVLTTIPSPLLTSEVRRAVERGRDWLERRHIPFSLGEKDLAESERLLSIDPRLLGWPWQTKDATFIFPTALGVIALWATGAATSARVAEALKVIENRACEGGGWNFGNPYMIGIAFPPTAVDTGISLAALKVAGRIDTAVARQATARLPQLLAQTYSALGLSWGVLALDAVGAVAAANAGRERLLEMQSASGGWSDSPFSSALSLLALRGGIANGGAWS